MPVFWGDRPPGQLTIPRFPKTMAILRARLSCVAHAPKPLYILPAAEHFVGEADATR